MNYFVFILKTSNAMPEQWIRHPVTQREFPAFGNRAEVYEVESDTEALQTADWLARNNPGSKVWISEGCKMVQAPLHKGTLSITELTEKGALPL